MQTTPPLTVIAALATVTAADATRPLLTFYDDATGERTDLSGATLGNWVAKTANLLTDGLGLGVGDTAAVRLPAHWQAAAVLLGCWSAGLTVDLVGETQAAVAFVAESVSTGADEVFALALAPLGMPFPSGPPPGTLDYVVEVRAHGDHSVPRTTPQTVALSDGTRHDELVRLGASRGVPAGGRVLVDGDRTPDPVDWLVAPLVAGASIVLCRHLDPTRVPARLTSERATPLVQGGAPY